MSEIITYDPKTKKRILDALFAYLYQPTTDSQSKRLNEIIRKNSLLKKNTQKAFSYKGEIYQTEDNHYLTRPINRLDPSLYPEMQQYLVEKEAIQNHEVPYVVNYLKQVLNASDHFPDYYNLLPESLHGILDRLKQECPCQKGKLTKRKIDSIQKKNILPVELMKQRMVHNLLQN